MQPYIVLGIAVLVVGVMYWSATYFDKHRK